MIQPLRLFFTLFISKVLPMAKRFPIGISALIFILASCNQEQTNSTAGGSYRPSYVLELPAPANISDTEKTRLNHTCKQWFDAVLKHSNFNGGMLVAKGGNIIFETYQGSNPLFGGKIIDMFTPFHIASVSKTFTAMATLKLMEEGKLQLQDEFSKYFPSFNYPGVTIRTLLCHRSGLPNYLYFMEDLKWDQTKAISNQNIYDILVSRKTSLTDISIPDTHFTYCNTNYALLALLIEKVSGLSYPQFIKKTFFDPLQMNNSYVFTPADSLRQTPSYDFRGHAVKNNYLDFVYGDKNIYTTPRDLMKWNSGLNSNVLFSDSTLKQAYEPQSHERKGSRNYGLGWRMTIFPNNRKVIYHNGWWHGNNASFIRLLKEDITIIVLGNRYNSGIYKAHQLINHLSDSINFSDIELK